MLRHLAHLLGEPAPGRAGEPLRRELREVVFFQRVEIPRREVWLRGGPRFFLRVSK